MSSTMLVIKSGGKDYELYSEWKEITIDRMCYLANKEQPKCLTKAMKAIDGSVIEGVNGIAAYWAVAATWTPEERNKELPTYIGEMLKVFTNMSDDVIDKIGPLQRTEFFHNFLIDKIFEANMLMKVQVASVTSFDFDGKTYYMPKIGKYINGDSMGIDLTAIEFAESSDIATQADNLIIGKLEALPYIIALLCKEKGEIYTEEGISIKAERFKKLDMQTAWEVYFFMQHCIRVLQSDMADYLAGLAQESYTKLQQMNQELIKQDGTGKSTN